MPRIGFIQNDLDLKMMILYLMDLVAAPISFLQLLDLAMCDSGVDYFSLSQAVGHMVETEHLSLEEGRYAITEKGRRNSKICEDSLPFSVRRRCDANLSALNQTLRRQEQVQSDILPNQDGSCMVRLFLADGGGVLMEAKLYAPTQEMGEKMAQRYQQEPERLYQLIAGFLNED